ncbi:MAG: hypothetical protein JXA33_20000, partial [Anaerolineae bacterium]|nr:hypothetical protein [Anaerolineae bacterium]
MFNKDRLIALLVVTLGLSSLIFLSSTPVHAAWCVRSQDAETPVQESMSEKSVSLESDMLPPQVVRRTGDSIEPQAWPTEPPTPIGYGQIVTGTISVPGQVMTYTLSAAAGEIVLMGLADSDYYFDPTIRLYAS